MLPYATKIQRVNIIHIDMYCKKGLIPKQLYCNPLRYTYTYIQLQPMSRVISRSTIQSSKPSSTIPPQPTDKKQKIPINLAAVRILGYFMAIKEKDRYQAFFGKCRRYVGYTRKIGAVVGAALSNLVVRKSRQYVGYGFRKLVAQRNQQIRQENEAAEARKNAIRTRSAALIGIIFRKLQKKRLKDIMETVNKKTKIMAKMVNYRNRHIVRIFEELTRKKIMLGFKSLSVNKAKFMRKKVALQRILKAYQNKKENNLLHIFTKLIQNRHTSQTGQQPQPQKQQQPQPLSQRGSRIKPITQRQPQPPTLAQQDQKKHELEDKNTKLEQQLSTLKQKNEKQLESYRQEINNLEAEHESLKFNNGILDEAIQELESQILQKQKKSRKGMPISQLWERVYSNFLLLLSQYKDQVVSKEKVLQHLECPLVPLNIDAEGLKAENQVLSELLEEYRKFFQGSQLPETTSQTLLPYDILVLKNKFMYLTLETLIRQGLGSEIEIKQLEMDLENVAKQA